MMPTYDECVSHFQKVRVKLTQFVTHKNKFYDIIPLYQIDGYRRKTLKIPLE